jgi:hypothetical protein
MFAHFLLLLGTGEAQIQPLAAHFGSILSIENRAGALRQVFRAKMRPLLGHVKYLIGEKKNWHRDVPIFGGRKR